MYKENFKKILFVMVFSIMLSTVGVVGANVDEILVSPTSTKILVDGSEESFEAYLIDGNNYLKLRDLAHAISKNKGEKTFDVEWDEGKRAINLISGEKYTASGGELEKGDGKDKKASLNKSKIYQHGKEIHLKAYTIEGNNFFKLRDIAESFDIGVSWIESMQTAEIDTSKIYDAEDKKVLDLSSIEEKMPGKELINKTSGYFVTSDRQDVALLYGGKDLNFHSEVDIVLVNGLTGEIISSLKEDTGAIGAGMEMRTFDISGHGDHIVSLWGYGGGTGTPEMVKLYKFNGENFEEIQYERQTDVEIIFKDNFKYEVKSDKLGKSYENDLNPGDRSYYIAEGFYSRDGKFLVDQNRFGSGYDHMSVVKNSSKEDYLLSSLYLWDTYDNKANLGAIRSYFKVEGDKLILVDLIVER